LQESGFSVMVSTGLYLRNQVKFESSVPTKNFRCPSETDRFLN